MDIYKVALFVHITALLAATAAGAIMKLASSRFSRARTVGELLDWYGVQAATSKVFPISLVLLAVTGATMISRSDPAVWRAGYVMAGGIGIAFLLVSGAYMGVRSKGLGSALRRMAENGLDAPAPAMKEPTPIAILSRVNPAVALAVTLVMVVKPASVAASIGIVTLGAALGAVGLLRAPQRASVRTADGA